MLLVHLVSTQHDKLRGPQQAPADPCSQLPRACLLTPGCLQHKQHKLADGLVTFSQAAASRTWGDRNSELQETPTGR